MKTFKKFSKKLKSSLTLMALILASLFSTEMNAQTKVKNIVIVHGAFADASGFRAVFDILTKQGYNVSVVQNPLTSLKDDVDTANRVIDKQDGPVILVGHSWGGSVITEAGNNPKVVALVYIAAFAPGSGETTLQWANSLPAAPENGILAPDAEGVVYFDKAK